MNCEIYNEDCIKGMKEHIKNDSVDLVLTDPPYNVALDKKAIKTISRWRNSRRNKVITSEWDKYAEEEYELFTEEWVKECYRIIRPKGWFLVWNSFRNIHTFIPLAQKIGFKYTNLFTYCKTNSAISFPYGLTPSCEYVIIFYKSSQNSSYEKYLNKKKVMKDYAVQPMVSNKERKESNWHPSPKPINILKNLINHFSKEGDTVFDCFIGGGSCAIASLEMKRNFKGFELNKEYYDTIMKRIKSFDDQTGLEKWMVNQSESR
jgi:DNA modification methylase